MNEVEKLIAHIGRKLIDLVKPLLGSQPQPVFVPAVVRRPRRLRRR